MLSSYYSGNFTRYSYIMFSKFYTMVCQSLRFCVDCLPQLIGSFAFSLHFMHTLRCYVALNLMYKLFSDTKKERSHSIVSVTYFLITRIGEYYISISCLKEL